MSLLNVLASNGPLVMRLSLSKGPSLMLNTDSYPSIEKWNMSLTVFKFVKEGALANVKYFCVFFSVIIFG